MQSVIFYLFLILSVLSVCYGIMVLSLGTGTLFCITWFMLGAFLLFCGIGARIHLWQMLPRWFRALFLLLLALGFLAVAVTTGLMVRTFKQPEKAGLDAIIVLGAQVNEDGPCVALRYRLDEAFDYLEQNPDTVCVVTGGQGYNEPCAEAIAMADYLMQKGIPEDRLLLEANSTTTFENMIFSKSLIDVRANVGIVTNDFHLYRALQIAREAGFENAYGIPAPSTRFYLPNNLFREFFAEVKFQMQRLRKVLK